MRKSKKKNGAGGFTFVELIVAMAVLLIASVILVSSYTNVMERKRMESDMVKLSSIDMAVKQVLLRDDAFDEILPYIQEGGTLMMRFLVYEENDDSSVVFDRASIGDNYNLALSCPLFYEYFIGYVGNEIELTSLSYQGGAYVVHVAFNVVHVSDSRDPVVTNDSFVVTNSGNEFLTP